jgi:hypothetical protein
MRIHGNFGRRFMKKHLRGSSSRAMNSDNTGSTSLVTGGSLYSEQLSKTVTNMPELSKQFGGLMSKKKTKKVILRI